MSIKKKATIFIIRTILVILMIALPSLSLGFASFVVIKTYNVSRMISNHQITNSSNEENKKAFDTKSKAREIISQTKQLAGLANPQLKKGTSKRVNILLLGKASEDYPGSALTDTVILASFNPQTSQTTMLSLPRDLYTPIPNSNQFTKLNAIYHYGLKQGGEKEGLEYIKQAVKNITGQEVDYFAMLDFKGFVKLVDEMGPIRVNVSQELTDHRYPGPNYSYQLFHIDKGWQNLDGQTALKYVRTRHNPGGDFGRAFRQQQVLVAIKKKFFSLVNISLLAKLNSILDIIAHNVTTDIEFSEYGSFLALAKNINIHGATNKVLDNRGNNPILTSHSSRVGRSRAYFLRPTAGDYSQIQEIAENIFDLNKLRSNWEKQTLEDPTVLIVNKSGSQSLLTEIKRRIGKAGFKRVSSQTETDDILASTFIYDNTEGLKPYSLNSLLKILDTQLKPEKYLKTENFDLVIILGDNARKLLEEEEVVLPQEAFGQTEY
ncbi:MAG: LCP family protein [Patescibacteria group bacterium]|nr:LCP family protein [Patescibacteria group bacterium]